MKWLKAFCKNPININSTLINMVMIHFTFLCLSEIWIKNQIQKNIFQICCTLCLNKRIQKLNVYCLKSGENVRNKTLVEKSSKNNFNYRNSVWFYSKSSLNKNRKSKVYWRRNRKFSPKMDEAWRTDMKSERDNKIQYQATMF